MGKVVSINPATGEVNGEFELYSASRINTAIKKAGTAFLEWKNLDVSERAEYLKNAAKSSKEEKMNWVRSSHWKWVRF